jgi:hypothetical protein
MLRKSLIVALGFLGLVLAGTAAGTQPASAGYSCGPWNNWCGPRLWAYPGYSFGWFGHGHKHWNKSYSHRPGTRAKAGITTRPTSTKAASTTVSPLESRHVIFEVTCRLHSALV